MTSEGVLAKFANHEEERSVKLSQRSRQQLLQREGAESALSVDYSENLNGRDRMEQRRRTVDLVLERTLETYQASARKLLTNLIRRVTERNNNKFSLMVDYQKVLSCFDNAFARIRSEDRVDKVEEIISTIERSEIVQKNAELQKTQLENEIEKVQAEVEKDRLFIMEALNESSKYIDSQKLKDIQTKHKYSHLDGVRTM
jgi:hypothetical protein